jgi:beta-glucosidase
MTRLRFLLAAFLLINAGLLIPIAAQTPPATERVDELTLEEKAALTTGATAWETFAVDRLGIPAAWMADGPVGLRKSTGENVTDSVPATCFPSSAGMAATWNEELIEKLGAGIGAEARAEKVSLLLAPGLNIKRHPLGGRNFEYYSEDPLLSGKTAAAFVRGVQSQGVGATLKHFAVNNQEHRRMSIDAQVGERALREIYLRGFEIAVKESSPQAVMSSYNMVNGTSASENPRLLTEILRDEWGFEGMVVSDWGAVNDPVAAVAAGLDLEMPGNPLTPQQIAAAVDSGQLDQSDLDRAAGNVLQLVDRHTVLAALPAPQDAPSNHDLARRVAIESMVLLENDEFLPLEDGAGAKLGVVGRLAVQPRVQGIGSSQINPTRLDTSWPFLKELGTQQGYAMAYWGAGYSESGLQEEEKGELASFLGSRDLVLVFAGQTASQDAEAWDRSSMSLSPADLEIVEAVKASGKPFGVVLVGGAAIDVSPFASQANAILMGWLGGQAFGSAIADVVFGKETPSGKLSETFAWSVADHASAMNFPGGPAAVLYGEGLYVGYRYFQTFGQDVAFPFGHGLSYTTFEYSNAGAPDLVSDLDDFDVGVNVRNSGSRRGAEAVQIYLRHLDPYLPRPERELVAFKKVELEPGESARVTISLEPADFAYFSDVHGKWVIEPGSYEILIGSSSTDIRATLPLTLEAGGLPERVLTADAIIGDIYEDPQGRAILDFMLTRFGRGPLSLATEDDFFAAILKNLPFKKLKNFSRGAMNDDAINSLMMLINSDMPPEQAVAALEQQIAAAQAAQGSADSNQPPPEE